MKRVNEESNSEAQRANFGQSNRRIRSNAIPRLLGSSYESEHFEVEDYYTWFINNNNATLFNNLSNEYYHTFDLELRKNI